MIEALKALADEYADIQRQLQDPSIFDKPSEVARLGKRSAYLEPLVNKLHKYQEAQRAIRDSEALLMDLELKIMAEEEIRKMKEIIPQLEEDMRSFLVPKDPMDERNAVIEVRAGSGGEEASLFAAELLRMYLRYVESRGWTAELIDKADSDTGGIKEAVVRIEGAGVFGDLKFEGGVHRVQRIPETENKGRVHTSAATVAVLPEAEGMDFTIRNEDLRIRTFRAGGAGGPPRNKHQASRRLPARGVSPIPRPGLRLGARGGVAGWRTARGPWSSCVRASMRRKRSAVRRRAVTCVRPRWEAGTEARKSAPTTSPRTA